MSGTATFSVSRILDYDVKCPLIAHPLAISDARTSKAGSNRTLAAVPRPGTPPVYDSSKILDVIRGVVSTPFNAKTLHLACGFIRAGAPAYREGADRRSAAEGPDLIPGVAPKVGLTARKLHSVKIRRRSDPPGGMLHLRFVSPGAPPITAPSFVVSEVEALRVGEGYAELTPGSLVVPADEVQGIFHVAAAAEQTSPLRLVFIPDRILCLRITLGRRRTAERYEPEPLARRPGIARVSATGRNGR